MFTAWVRFRGGDGAIEIREACAKIEHLFVSNQHGDRIQDSRFPDRIVRNLLAYRIGDTVTNNVEYCVPTSIFAKELADGVEKSELVKNAIAQQVNQLVTKTEELQKQLEAQPYAKVDFGSTEIAERSHEVVDLHSSSLGTLDGAKKRSRKGKSSAKLD